MARFTLKYEIHAGQWWPGRRTPLIPGALWSLPAERYEKGAIIGVVNDNSEAPSTLPCCKLHPGDWLVEYRFGMVGVGLEVYTHTEFVKKFEPVSPEELENDFAAARTCDTYLYR